MNEDFSTKTKLNDLARWHVNEFVKELAQQLPRGSWLLDAGAGEGVYRRHFEHCEYRSIDLAVGESRWDYGHLDYVGPLHDMPIESGKFDAVLCTQVLEHLEFPRESVREMCRVLKPGGRLYLTVPMSQNEHQMPYDFFRYTSYGLRSICQQAGFEAVDVRPFGGMWTRWAYELPRGLAALPSSGLMSGKPSLGGVLALPLRQGLALTVRVLQMAFLEVEKFDPRPNDPWGWSCVAIKREAGEGAHKGWQAVSTTSR